VHPTGSPVVVGANNGMHSFDVNATTATAAAGSPFVTPGAFPFSCRFSADGSYVYSGGNTGTTIAGFAVDAGSGVLTPLPGSPFATGANSPVGYATDSAGRLFTSNFGNGVRAFTSSSGVLTAVTGNPFASGLAGGVAGTLHPFGFYMVADRTSSQVGVFRIAGSGAATTLTAVTGSPFASGGSFTDAVALTEDGSWLLAANGVTRNLTVFKVNPATGALTSVSTQPVNTLGASGIVTGITFAAVVPPFIDDPLTALSSVIQAVHIRELRTRIDAVRAQYGIGPYPYTDPTLTATVMFVRAVHINELRAALADAYAAAGVPQPPYTDSILTAGTTVVKAAHISELRAAVVAIE
jgi:sugar lactone lactonase YvrE